MPVPPQTKTAAAAAAQQQQQQQETIKLRLADLRDLARITTICIESLPDDPTFDYLWRYRHRFPADNQFFWLQTLKAHLFDPRYTMLVAVLYSPSSSPEKIAGEENLEETIISFALWERNGNTRAAKRRVRKRNSLNNRLHNGLTHAENWLISRRYTRRDADFARLEAFGNVMEDIHRQYWEKKYANNFRLDLLCTIREHRRKGAGTMLTQWGMDQAKREDANVGVESSPMGLPLYEHLGFKMEEIRHVIVKGDDEQLLVRVMALAAGSW
ncbi:hypothetical protein FN846DRAFT_920917 [Sphaerosporella brunnea]|uniref:N-acetyltransferase domain-containing protein n=1 Tax=Sphaerosporella brunnea TaxID=1250544 RepID=A0A5J5EQM6_9PEZI|nr:hypothetical protein FN846DRAFT_920917 [Sphaerosporella brunnea]